MSETLQIQLERATHECDMMSAISASVGLLDLDLAGDPLSASGNDNELYRAVFAASVACGADSLSGSCKARTWGAVANVAAMHSLVDAQILALEHSVAAMPFGPRLVILGTLYGRADKIEKAKAAFEEALCLDAADDEAMANLAYWVYSHSDPPRAIRLYELALARNSNNVFAAEQLAYLLASRDGVSSQAVVLLEAALNAHPLEATARAVLADQCWRLGRIEEARVHFALAAVVGSEAIKNMSLHFFSETENTSWVVRNGMASFTSGLMGHHELRAYATQLDILGLGRLADHIRVFLSAYNCGTE
ncbi:MAG: hypothetical protein KF757_10545 [Phycisphaeraceae bacterium]|nr:hypothetical protein [Phycisphaeraceae bacterium]MCW5764080.1 hypothetical protein [Phycisphaeraceae bacterium]